ncbi:MAG: glycosyltransferase family 39 protein, partial [Bacteroidota bacterium]
MEYLPGILLLIGSSTLLGYSLYSYKTHSYKQALWALILLGLMLRIYTAADPFLHKWDERYHALVAKNMIEEPFAPKFYKEAVLAYDYKNWAANHIWLHKQPVSLWSLMMSMKIFGVNEFAIRIPSILLSSLFIFLVFAISEELYSKKVGVLAAFFAAIHGLIIELSAGRVATDHVDIHFMVFISLSVLSAIYFHKREKLIYNLLCAIFLALAILCKWLPALIVLPLWVLLGLKRGKNIKKLILPFLLLMGVTSLGVLPWQLYILAEFPLEANWEFSYNRKHVFEQLEQHAGDFLYFFTKIRIQYGELVYLPIVWMVYKSWKRKIELKSLFLLSWLFIPFVFFSLAQTKMKAYLLFTSPAIFIMVALFFHYLNIYQNRFKQKWVVKLILILLLILPLRYSLERLKIFKERNPQEEVLKDKFNTYPADAVVFNQEL